MRFPGFQEEWIKYRISDILEFFPTNSLSWDQLEYEAGNLHNLHYGLIHKGLPTQVVLDECYLPNIKEEFIPNNYTFCKDGDIAFADASEDTNDVAKVIEFLSCNNKSVICGLHTIHGRDKQQLTINGFKGYAFSSTVFRHQIRKLAQGTKVYSVSQKNFHECSIGIPSKEEQTKIAHLMQLVDARIQTQNKIIEDLKELKASLSKQIFSHKLQFKDEKGSDFPEWRNIPLSNVVVRITQKNNILNTNILTISAQMGLVNQLLYYKKNIASKDLSNYYILSKGDFAYNKSYSTGYPFGVFKRLEKYISGIVSPLYICFRSKSNIDSDFLVQYFEAGKMNDEIQSIAQEGARNHGLLNVGITDFFSLYIEYPSIIDGQNKNGKNV